MEQTNAISYEGLKNKRYPPGDTSQQTKNACSALNSFMEYLQKKPTDLVGSELLEDFDTVVDRYLSLENATPATKYTKKSHLKKWCQFYAQKYAPGTLESKGHNLKSFLKMKLTVLGKTPDWLSKKAGSRTVSGWVNNNHNFYPSEKSKELLAKVSVILGLERNFLWNQFAYYPKTIKHPFTRRETDYHARLKTVKNDFYSISEKNWNSEELKTVRAEIQELYHFKTDTVLPDHIFRNVNEIWSVDAEKNCGSLNHFVRMMKSFLGYLTKEKSIPFSKLTLRLALNSKHISDYITFLSRRHGLLTKTAKGFLSDVRLLVKYYIQFPKIGYPELSEDDGVEAAEKHLKYLKKKIESTKFVDVSRDPEDQIQPFLDLHGTGNPLDPFFEAISVLEKQYEFAQREQPYLLWSHELARNIVFLMFILEKPIRAKNFANLRWEKNLYKLPSGRYELRLNKNEVKNNANIRKTLSEDLSKWIDVYRENHYKKINPNAKDYVFISNTELKYTAVTISKLMGRICLDLIGIELRCHSFRHLRATAYLLQHPEDYIYVAELLNDDLKTVIRAYSHIEGRASSKDDDNDLTNLRKKHSQKM